VDAELLGSLRDAGADALEVGIPFSDPVMDGGVIQEASRVALEAGARPADVLSTVAKADLDIPVAVMTYANPVRRLGFDEFLERSVEAGVSGFIVPDLPVDEATEWVERCRTRNAATIFLAAPGSSAERLRAIAAEARGFVYCVSTYGVTGARESLAGTARDVVTALRPLTDRPLLVGVGIGDPPQAAEACGFADGVIVGSALMARLMEGDRSGAVDLCATFRAAIPTGA
jgi:tryptophan synthase alpha chain